MIAAADCFIQALASITQPASVVTPLFIIFRSIDPGFREIASRVLPRINPNDDNGSASPCWGPMSIRELADIINKLYGELYPEWVDIIVYLESKRCLLIECEFSPTIVSSISETLHSTSPYAPFRVKLLDVETSAFFPSPATKSLAGIYGYLNPDVRIVSYGVDLS